MYLWQQRTENNISRVNMSQEARLCGICTDQLWPTAEQLPKVKAMSDPQVDILSRLSRLLTVLEPTHDSIKLHLQQLRLDYQRVRDKSKKT